MAQKSALVILSDLAEELEVASPVDFLRLCGIEVTVAGLNGNGAIKCARGLTIVPDLSLEEVKDKVFDVIVMPGGRMGSDFIAESELVGEILIRQNKRNGLIAGICGSPKALLKNKIGFGKKITSYPTSREKLCQDFNYSEDSVVQDGNLITARGPAQALEWSKVIAQNLVDEETVTKATKHMLL
jgi:DJ-1 family protein